MRIKLHNIIKNCKKNIEMQKMEKDKKEEDLAGLEINSFFLRKIILF
jgi:hypothetical protein